MSRTSDLDIAVQDLLAGCRENRIRTAVMQDEATIWVDVSFRRWLRPQWVWIAFFRMLGRVPPWAYRIRPCPPPEESENG